MSIMAQRTQSEEYPKGSKIKLRPIENITQGQKRGISWQVTVPSKVTGNGRVRKQFQTEKEAKAFAEKQHKGAQQEGEAYFNLTPEERREIGIMVPKLRKKGISISYAIQYAIDRVPTGGKERTLDEVVKELRESKLERQMRGKLSSHTIRTFDYQTKKLLSSLGGGTLVHEITKELMEGYIRSIKGEDRTRKNYYRAANEVLGYARQKGYIEMNPMGDWADEDKKRLYGGDESEEDMDIGILTVKEIEDFLNYTREHRPEFLAFVVLASFTGIRTEELQKLDWSKVNLETGFVTLDASITKKRRKRFVPIPDNAKQWLMTIENRNGMVVPYSGNVFRNEYHRLRLAAGWENEDGTSKWVKNGLRHSFGSYHYALTGDSIETARLMGHRQGDTTLFDHYAALATKEQGEAYFSILPRAGSTIVLSLKGASA